MSGHQYIKFLEKILSVPLILLLLLTIAFNANNINQSRQRVVMQNNQQEYNLQALVSPYGQVKIVVEEEDLYPQLQLLINGEAIAKFRGNQVIAQVRNGDLVQIDGSMYKEPITVIIEAVSKNVISPIENYKIVLNSNIEVLSTIRMQ